MFELPALQTSSTDRAGTGHLLGEVVATAGRVALVFALARSGRAGYAPAAVSAYIGSAYWFTSSTSFANPAVTVGRVVTDTFAGVVPGSAVPFIAAQVVGAAIGCGLVLALYPVAGVAADVVLPHPGETENKRR